MHYTSNNAAVNQILIKARAQVVVCLYFILFIRISEGLSGFFQAKLRLSYKGEKVCDVLAMQNQICFLHLMYLQCP